MPKVSIIVPVYCVENYIERCVRTLFEQTLEDIEYLFIDDCSPDNSVNLLRSILDDYPQRKLQTRIVRMNNNSGQAQVRMRGIKEATGEYILFCDSDDWVNREMSSLLYAAAKKNDSSIVICDYYIASDTENFIEKKESVSCSISNEDLIRDILKATVSSSLWNKLIKRSLLVDYPILPPAGNMGEDMVLLVQAVFYSSCISYYGKPLYYYFNNSSSITNNMSAPKVYERFKTSSLNTDIIESFFRQKGLLKLVDGEFTYLKLRKINLLLPLLSQKEYYSEWKNSYPELKWNVIKSSAVPFREKVRFYLYYFGFRFI